MKLTDLNPDGGIGANSLYIELGPFKFLIDAGINPKYVGKEATPDFSSVEDGSLDFIILTHCHLDHLGALPLISRRQPQAPIISSLPTQMLACRMLKNSVNVMRRQREEKGIKDYPLYGLAEVHELEERFVPIRYGKPRIFEAHGENLELTLFRAGHIPGAVGARIVYKHRVIFFTGDVLFTKQRILDGADFPNEPIDTLVMETTRGLTPRSPEKTRASEVQRLFATINHTIERGGSVMIPIFALGRMQEILALIHDARKNKELLECPIYCAGLGLDLADYFDQISKKTNLVHFKKSILKSLKLKQIPRDLKPGKDPGNKGIYIVSSGMMVENTPSYHLAASLLDHHHNAICFVGYCDPETPGGELLERKLGDSFLFKTLEYVSTVQAHIEKFDLSGHADREELLEYALSVEPRAIVLSHGDPEARNWFHDELIDALPKVKVIDPTPLETHTI